MHTKIVAACGPLLAGLFLVSSPTRAQAAQSGGEGAADGAAGLDEVILKNGGMLRGTIVAVEPDVEVAVLVAGTTSLRVTTTTSTSATSRRPPTPSSRRAARSPPCSSASPASRSSWAGSAS
jgi:hypothetical protein